MKKFLLLPGCLVFILGFFILNKTGTGQIAAQTNQYYCTQSCCYSNAYPTTWVNHYWSWNKDDPVVNDIPLCEGCQSACFSKNCGAEQIDIAGAAPGTGIWKRHDKSCEPTSPPLPPKSPTPTPVQRPYVCTSSSISKSVLNSGQSLTVTINGTPPSGTAIKSFTLAFYNRDNGTKPIFFSGTAQYQKVITAASGQTSATFTVSYSEINKPDLNWGGKYPVNFQVNGYFTLSDGRFSAADGKCVKWFSKGVIITTPTKTPTPPPKTPTKSPTPYLNALTCTKVVTLVNGYALPVGGQVKVGNNVSFVAYGTAAGGKIIRYMNFRLLNKTTNKYVFSQMVPAGKTSSGTYIGRTSSYKITSTGSYQVSAQMLEYSVTTSN